MFQNAKMNYTVVWAKSDAAIEGEVITVSKNGKLLASYCPSSLGKGWERRKRINQLMESGPF